MRTYIIGDVHGCLQTLELLWQRLDFDHGADRLWLTGDLVHRGPDSAGVLRWARRRQDELGERFQAVLGNHDLLLLAVAAGVVKERRKDFSSQVLEQADAEDLLEWLAHRPLLHDDPTATLVHAGLLPQWSLEDATAAARQVEAGLASDRRQDLLRAIHGLTVDDPALLPVAEQAQVLTRIRTCTAEGSMSRYSGPPSGAPGGHRAWFEHRPRSSPAMLFGHWAALGLYRSRTATCLDTGCAWGRFLTVLELPSGRILQEPCADPVQVRFPP